LGIPKISDFGLARAVEDDPETAPPYRTESGAIVGTPNYMAPEQATGQGRAVGPAADVYALGAILYECLTGRPPFKAATILETLEQVRSQEPVPPGRLQPGLPRDLQTICLKCLQKEPARRYASAEEMADDLGRFLRGGPILARPLPRWERVWKWVRRKPALAGLLALSVVSLAVVVAGDLVYRAQLEDALEQAQASETRARRQRQRADAGYRAARDTLNRMLGRLESRRLGQVPRLKELQRDLLEDALAFYQGNLEKADSRDPTVRRDTAWACQRAAAIQQLLGRPKVAAENLRRAIDLLDGLPALDRAASECQTLLAGCYNNLGLLALEARRWDEAEQHHRAALAICERSHQAQPEDRGWRSALAETEHNLGVRFQLPGNLVTAEPHYARAAALRAGLVSDHPREERYQAALASNHVNLGLIYQATRRPGKATRAFASAEALLLSLIARHPPGGEHALTLAGVNVNWGNLLRSIGRTQDALARHTRAVEAVEAVLRREPAHSVARLRGWQAHGARAQTLEALRRWAEAVKDWDRVVELDVQRNRWIRRVLRALVLARAGEHARAAAEVKTLARHPKVSAEGLYDLACACAQSVEPARSDGRLPPSERAALAERYAAQAVALLQKLQAKGYFKDAAHARALRTDEDLRPLRDRADFRRLLAAVTGNKQG
jgi:tetratricopeptide (TPR) repeat protein